MPGRAIDEKLIVVHECQLSQAVVDGVGSDDALYRGAQEASGESTTKADRGLGKSGADGSSTMMLVTRSWSLGGFYRLRLLPCLGTTKLCHNVTDSPGGFS